MGGGPKGIQGASMYTAPNPEYGATFTYYIKESYSSKKSKRQKEEKKLTKSNSDIPFPGWDVIEDERIELGPKVWIMIKDSKGVVVMKMPASKSKGLHRTTWDLRHAHADAIPLNVKPYKKKVPSMFPCAPGMYSATLYKQIEGSITQIADPIEFEVAPLYKSSIKDVNLDEVAEFWREMEELDQYLTATSRSISNGIKRVMAMENALAVSNVEFGSLYSQWEELRLEFDALYTKLGGNHSKKQVGARTVMTIWDRYNVAQTGVEMSAYGPTAMHLESIVIAKEEHAALRAELEILLNDKIPAMEKALIEVGAPWIQGMPLPVSTEDKLEER